MKFELALPGRVIFGQGSRSQIGDVLSSFGKKTLLIYSKTLPMIPEIIHSIEENRVNAVTISISGEPTILSINEILNIFRGTELDSVISVGGGSIIDTGKAVSAKLANPGNLLDYLEIVGKSLPLQNPPIPFVAVPSTAGTGSEVTKNAVIAVPDQKIKVSMRSPMMVPRVSIIDPEITLSMPAEVTASTGMDALIQLIEPFLSIRANEFVDSLCIEGLKRGAKSLFPAVENGMDIISRENMCYSCLCGGMALANSGLGAVHGFAGVIGGLHTISHGMICAALLPAVLKGNLEAMKEREPGNPAIEKYRVLSQLFSDNRDTSETGCIKWAEDTCLRIGIKNLSDLGIQRSEFPNIMVKAARSSSMKGNPIQLSENELYSILENAY
jgi:alcohol dehydrogenase class IV